MEHSRDKIDGFEKSRKCSLSIIPAKAGIQCFQVLMKPLDPVFQRGDDFLLYHPNFEFLRFHQN
ncbi:MAG: hypothetical protein COX20_03915 [Desulfobacterales bacterium CG23_combo_of_CG06-09_8_20_14_all_52_9]|nr:MAG: hypothetical protein COX20_03915 [Desulfobacterales bacterium CG23_combo_of_CG06-09_8_20_14_all_52_9]